MRKNETQPNTDIEKVSNLEPDRTPTVADEHDNPNLKILSYEDVVTLKTNLEKIAGYQTGNYYRNDFDAALPNLEKYGFTVHIGRAVTEAKKVQEDLIQRESN